MAVLVLPRNDTNVPELYVGSGAELLLVALPALRAEKRHAQLATLELRANVLAAYVAGGRAREVPAVMAAMKFGAQDSFEIAFNAACALLGAGDAPAAEQQLLLAQRLGARRLA